MHEKNRRLVFLLAWAAHQWLAHGHQQTATVVGALVVGLAGLVVPATIRWIYVGCMIAAFPVDWVVFQVMLAVLFYVMITPVALLFRWRGRDSLHCAPARELLDGEIPAGGFAAILPAILAGERTRIFL